MYNEKSLGSSDCRVWWPARYTIARDGRSKPLGVACVACLERLARRIRQPRRVNTRNLAKSSLKSDYPRTGKHPSSYYSELQRSYNQENSRFIDRNQKDIESLLAIHHRPTRFLTISCRMVSKIPQIAGKALASYSNLLKNV